MEIPAYNVCMNKKGIYVVQMVIGGGSSLQTVDILNLPPYHGFHNGEPKFDGSKIQAAQYPIRTPAGAANALAATYDMWHWERSIDIHGSTNFPFEDNPILLTIADYAVLRHESRNCRHISNDRKSLSTVDIAALGDILEEKLKTLRIQNYQGIFTEGDLVRNNVVLFRR